MYRVERTRRRKACHETKPDSSPESASVASKPSVEQKAVETCLQPSIPEDSPDPAVPFSCMKMGKLGEVRNRRSDMTRIHFWSDPQASKPHAIWTSAGVSLRRFGSGF